MLDQFYETWVKDQFLAFINTISKLLLRLSDSAQCRRSVYS